MNAARDRLAVSFDDGARFELAAEYLRVESPSAEVKGHGPGQRQTVSTKRAVKIARLEPVGNYAVRIVFDDGHDTGLYFSASRSDRGCRSPRRAPTALSDTVVRGLPATPAEARADTRRPNAGRSGRSRSHRSTTGPRCLHL